MRAAAILISMLFIGCGTDPVTGKRVFWRSSCDNIAAGLKMANAACLIVPDHDDPDAVDRNRQICAGVADLTAAAVEMGCVFATPDP